MTEMIRSILLIDDCVEDRETYRRYLLQNNRYTYRILEADSGEQALSTCSVQFPDAILLDFLLPDMDGLEVLSELKATRGTDYLPVVMLTGQGSEEVAVAAIKGGAFDYLIKHKITAENLRLAIRHAIERDRLQRQLELSQQRYSNLAKAAPVGIFHTDASGHCLYVNEKWCEITGLTPQDALGEGWVNALHPDDRSRVFTEWNQATQCERAFQLEYRFVRPDGGTTWVLSQAVAETGSAKKVTGYIGTIVDITERQQAEQQIHNLLDIVTDAIIICDRSNQITFWNRGAELLYGWQASEALGKNPHELFYQESSPQLALAQKLVVETGLWQGELQQVTKSGNTILVASRWTLVCDAQQTQSIIVVNSDITEKKQLEAQFLRAQRLESIGTLAGGIAHDLNNILAPILMIAQLLQRKISDQRSQQLLAALESSAKRGASLVKQVLSFARGVEGKRTILQVRHLLQEISEIAKQTFPKSIGVYTDILPTLWTVSGDATHLHQVLMNLVVNARDAMPNGGNLRISAENLVIDESYAQMPIDASVGYYIVITVADTGSGIPPEILDRIFEPFFTTKEVGKGTGLGLSTALGIIKSHGGFVNVYSEVGKGTRFKVYLPAVAGIETQQVEDLELPTGHGELILLVDDEIAILDITKTSLSTYGYKVLTANDGFEANAVYAQHQDQISAVVINMMMPQMDGLTTIRILRKMKPQLKIIAMSGLMSNEVIAEAASIQAFLTKPYTAAELLKTLHSLLSANNS